MARVEINPKTLREIVACVILNRTRSYRRYPDGAIDRILSNLPMTIERDDGREAKIHGDAIISEIDRRLTLEEYEVEELYAGA